MINIINKSNDPYFNLALEEYFMKYKDMKEDVLILWQNEPTIVIGKNQNAYEEINRDFVEKNKINVVRRMSGGGAVYHDFGNLNYTIIKNDGKLHANDFSFFALPVVACLKKFDVDAEFNGRNDITIDGKKFSGNAQYFYKSKVLHHGTLMFSSDLAVLSQALIVDKEKIESKGIKSVKSRVTNISEYINKDITFADFHNSLLISMFHEDRESIQNYELTNEDISAITEIRNNKYNTWDWNFGKSPQMSYQKKIRFLAGSVSLITHVKDGMIDSCNLYGDFFEVNPVEGLTKKIEGRRYDKSEIEALLSDVNIQEYIYMLSNEEFKQLWF
ncbi:lipoate--protein ligase [Lacrimispora sp. 38-1]|uniref:lipoate--protein ligase n=1 Tax=Lacrimispora sp. 38-1 TaxID=3125778 RepID=UPI003CFB4165